MKIARLALAVMLAAGTVAAYVWFPNPLELAAEDQAAVPAPGPDAQAPTGLPPAGEGESI